MVTAADVKARCLDPIIQAFDDAVITARIAEVENRTNRDAWGSKADSGVIFLVAHMLLLDKRALDGKAGQFKGPLTSESVGPLSRSFASPLGRGNEQDAWLMQTQWGMQYLELRKLVFAMRTDFDPNSSGCVL